MSGDSLRVEGLRVAFGGLTAVDGVSFAVDPGRITGLIGPNGSGKSTLFNLIGGALRPQAGEVWLGPRRITRWAPHRIAAAGLARTFQISRIFGQMTVWENMLVAAREDPGALPGEDRARDLLALVTLYELRDNLGADLSFGQQRLLELARALMLDPRVVLLDEPFAGINPTLGQTVAALLRRLREEGRTILLIDHAMAVIMDLCERVLVMDMGQLIADGPPAAVQADERVLEAYFGRRASVGGEGAR